MSQAAPGAVLVCVPTYNERDTVGPLVDQVLAVCPAAEVLIIDDASPDGTGALADAVAEREPRLHVLHRPGKAGLGRAYLAGFAWALERGFERICEMDADLSHEPRALPGLLAASRDADLVLGSRYVPGGGARNWGLWRRLLSRGGCLYARLLLGVRVRDLTGGFKCFRREVLGAIDLGAVRTSGYAFQIELTYRALCAGFRVTEVPITFVERREGRSKMSLGIALEAVLAVPRLRLSVPRGALSGTRT